MALDKLVDSTQLDSDLTSVANAIRTKGGTSAQLAFPAGFVSAINDISGGDPAELLRKLLENTETSYIDDSLTKITCVIPPNIVTFQCHNVTQITAAPFNGAKIVKLAFPNVTGNNANVNFVFRVGSTLTHLDLSVGTIPAGGVRENSNLKTLVLRSTSVPTLGNANAFYGTPFYSGGSGGTIYIPKSLYDKLGTGTNDYKAASNWSTIDGYGKTTWAQIEGSYYETHYADDTEI